MALPFANTPIFQSQGDVFLSLGLHQVAEVVAVVCITPETVVGVSGERLVGFHPMVGFRLLFPRLYFVYRTGFKCLSFLFGLCQLRQMSFVIVFRKGKPIHHIARVVYFEERLQFIMNRIFHSGGQGEVQRFSRNGLQLVGNAFNVVVDEYRRLVGRKFFPAGILSESAIVGNEVSHIFRSGLHAQHDGAMHQCDILRNIRQILHTVVHREGEFNHIVLLPLAVDGYIR